MRAPRLFPFSDSQAEPCFVRNGLHFNAEPHPAEIQTEGAGQSSGVQSKGRCRFCVRSAVPVAMLRDAFAPECSAARSVGPAAAGR